MEKQLMLKWTVILNLFGWIYCASFTGPFNWAMIESTTTPDTPYCFTTSPADAVVSLNGQPTGKPTPYCIHCFGLWKDNTRNKYCLFFTPSTVNRLDYDQANQYTFDVQANDGTATIGYTTVTLNISPNLPPYFANGITSATLTVAVSTAVDTSILTIPVDDLEDKPKLIYTIDNSNQSQFFYIDNSGNLKIRSSLNGLCADSTELLIRVSDGFNPAIGPMKVNINIDRGGVSYKPIISSKSVVRRVVENTKGDFFYLSGEFLKGGRCTVTSSPGTMLAQYSFICSDNRVYALQAGDINFEVTPPVNYTIVYNNGFCDSDPFWYYITWSDVPEKPTLAVSPNTYTANEGFVSVKPVYNLTDEDTGDTHKYGITAASTGDFNINSATGEIYSPAYFGLNKQSNQNIVVDVSVTDSANLVSNQIRLIITIKDINDNRPVVDPYTTAYTITDCIATGLIAVLTAQDNDFGSNADVEFLPSSSGSMILYLNGELWLKSPPIAGQVDSITIRAKDNGSPSLTSTAGRVSVIGIACPTTPPPAATVTPVAAATSALTLPPPTTIQSTPPPTTAPSQAGVFDSPLNIVLVVLGALLLLLIIGLSACFVYRCCCSGRRDASNISSVSKHSKINSVNPSTPLYQRPQHHWSDDTSKAGTHADTESGIYSEDSFDEHHKTSTQSGSNSNVSRGRNGEKVDKTGYDFESGFHEDKVVGKPSSTNNGNIFWMEHFLEESLTQTPNRKSVPETVSSL